MYAALLVFLHGARAGIPAAPKLKLDGEVPAVQAAGACYPSGLQVVMVSRPGSGTATTAWVVDAGQADDPEGEGGSVHLIEHLWFRSHPARGPEFRQVAWDLDAHAKTYVDTTVFHATSSAADLEKLLELHSWVLAAPLYGVTEEVFAAERDVVKHEAWYRGAHGSNRALRVLDQVLYPESHPYHDSLPSPGELEALTLESVAEVAADLFVPDGATLYVEADATQEEIEAAVEASLPSRLTTGTGSDCSRALEAEVPETPASTELLHFKGPRWRPAVYVSWALPPLPATDTALTALAELQLKANVYQELKAVPGLKQFDSTESMHCGTHFGRESSQFTCVVSIPSEVDPTKVVKAVRRGLADASNEAANDDWMTRDALSWEANTLREVWREEHESSRADALVDRALHAHHFASVSLLHDRLAGLAELDHGQIADFTRTWLKPERMAAVYLEPDPGPMLDLARVSGRALLEPTAGDWTPPPGPRDLEVRLLDNGVELWSLQRANSNVAHADWLFEGGSMRDPDPGTNEVLDYMTVYRMSVGFSDLRRRAGTRAFHHFGSWTNALSARSPSGNLDAGLWAIRSMAEGQEWDLSERQYELDRQALYALRSAPALPSVFAPSVARQHLFPEHRASMAWWDRNRAATAVGVNRVHQWRASVYRPERSRLVVVSDLPTAEVGKLADKYIGRFRARGRDQGMARGTDPLPPPPDRQGLAFAFPGMVSVVETACRVPGYGPESAAVSRVATAALQRALFESLRTEGGSYGPWVQASPLTPDLAVLELGAEVAPPDGRNTVRAMLGVIEALASGEHDAFVASAVSRARTDWARSFSSADGARSSLRTTATWGLSAEDVKHLDERIAAVTAEDVARYLDDCHGHEAVTLVGHEAAAQLEAAGLEVRTVDWEGTRDRLLEAME